MKTKWEKMQYPLRKLKKKKNLISRLGQVEESFQNSKIT